MEQQPKLKLLDRCAPRAFITAKKVFKEAGIKGVIRHFGWRFFALFFMYYLVRDLTIYVFLPWYLANKMI